MTAAAPGEPAPATSENPRGHGRQAAGGAIEAPRRRRPGRPRGSDPATTRRRILDAAIDLIGCQGYGATSLAQVAAAAGLSPTGLAHHVGSREDLLAAVLAHRDELDALGEDAARGPAPFALLDALVDLARRNAQRPHLVRLFVAVGGEATAADHPGHAWLRTHYASVIGDLSAAFRAGIERGALRPETPAEMLAREIVALMDGLQTQWLLDPAVDMPGILAARIEEIRERWAL